MKNNSLHSFDDTLKQSFENLLLVGLKEDIGEHQEDITTKVLFSDTEKSPLIKAKILAKEDLVVCGLPFLFIVFKRANEIKLLKKEGDFVTAGESLAIVVINAKEFLLRERVTLNILQRLCGIATKTHEIRKILSPKVKLLDTRKTIPGYRLLEKYAVKVGGGENHRMGLFDEYMIKDNHITAYQKQNKNALLPIIHLMGADRNAFYEKEKKFRKIIVECKNLFEVNECLLGLEKGYLNQEDVIMLDNMSEDYLKKSIEIIGKRLKIEISGGINKESITMINDLSKKGFLIDRISSGAITHHAPASDINFKIVEIPLF